MLHKMLADGVEESLYDKYFNPETRESGNANNEEKDDFSSDEEQGTFISGIRYVYRFTFYGGI